MHCSWMQNKHCDLAHSSISDPDTKRWCSHFLFFSRPSPHMNTLEWMAAVHDGGDFKSNTLIYRISVHIFICYTNIDFSQPRSNVLNSQLEINIKQKIYIYCIRVQDPIRVWIRFCLLFRSAKHVSGMAVL